MLKTISQNTFNNIVKENMELFDMQLDAAIAEAKNQSESQGINLYNIITDSSMFQIKNDEIIIIDHPVVGHLNNIKTILSEKSNQWLKLEEHLESLKNYYQSDIAYRIMGANNGGQLILENILNLAIELHEKSVIRNCLITFSHFLIGQPDIVSGGFLEYLVNIIKSKSLDENYISLIFKIFSHCCTLCESNKEILINEPNNIIPLCIDQLEIFGSQSKEVVKEVCSFVRSLILDDDIRVSFGRGTENAKTIVTETNCLNILLKLCKEYKESGTEVVAELFYTLDKLSVRNEFCQRVLDIGGLDLIIEALENHINSARIVTPSLAVMKSLAANDRVKVEIGRKNCLGLIIRATEIHIHNQNVCVNAFGTMAAVSLRECDNSRNLVKLGLPQLLKQAIQIHADQKNFLALRAICLTTRNVVARCPELRDDILEVGLEELLNVVLSLGRQCDDEAKAALRDLGCKVELKELWTGKVGVKVQQS